MKQDSESHHPEFVVYFVIADIHNPASHLLKQNRIYDPLAKIVTVYPGRMEVPYYNMLEGVHYSEMEQQEELWLAMQKEHRDPTPENKIACFEIIKAMNLDYWKEKELSDGMLRQAIQQFNKD